MQQTKTLVPLVHWEKAIKANDPILIDLAKNSRLVVYDESRNFFQPVRGANNEWVLQLADDK